MVVKTLLKRGIKKLTKKKPKTKPKTKPTPRYRTDPKTGQKFLNRRATVSGVKKKTSLKDFSSAEKKIMAVSGTAAAGTLAYQNYEKIKNKLKEATDKIREKDKKKKEKRKDNQRQK